MKKSVAPLEIIFVANSIVGVHPGVSGGETRFLEMARGFNLAGHHIHLLSSAGAKELLKEFGVKAKLHIISTSGSTGRVVFWGRLVQSIFALPPSLGEEKFDIVYACSEQIYDVIAGLKIRMRNRGSKLAVAVHWLPPTPPWKRTGNKFFNNLFFWLSERLGLYLAVLFADILLPVSEATGAQLRAARIPDRKFTVVECGVDFAGIRKAVRKKGRIRYDGIFMKRIQRAKGIFDLINAWKLVVDRFPKAKLGIIGEGIDRNAAEELVKKLGLSKNIEFLGVIYDFTEKYRLLASSKTFLLPTHEENWAIVIGEAMATGTPVISYGLAELKAVWGDACFWVKPLDVTGFADAVMRLLKYEPSRKAKSQEALKFVQRYDWAAIAKRELEIIISR